MGRIVDVEHHLVVDQQVVVERVVIGPRSRRHLIDVRPLPVTAVGGAVRKQIVHYGRARCVVNIELNHFVPDHHIMVDQNRVPIVVAHFEEDALDAVVDDHVPRDASTGKAVVEPDAVVQGIVGDVIMFDQPLSHVMALDSRMLVTLVADEAECVVS